MKQPEHARIAAGILKRMIDAAKKSREPAMKQGREIMRYGYAPDYNFEYQKQLSNAWFKAKVALTAEAFQLFVPYLAPSLPHRTVTARKWVGPEGQARASVMQDYLNYTPRETNLRDQSRRALVEAIGYGRGVVWTGRDPRTGLVRSMYDSVRNLLIDPNAQTPEERRYVVRRRVMPRYEAIRLYPAAKALLQQEPAYTQRASDSDAKHEWEKEDTACECVCFYEAFLMHGLHHYQGGTKLVQALSQAQGMALSEGQAKSVEIDDTPLKYVVTEAGALIAAEPWEIPYHEDGEFPCTPIDLLDCPDGDWAPSVLAPALGWQRAINWVVTMLMGKYRFTSRTIGAIAKNVGSMSDKDKSRVLMGNDVEMIEITVNGETKTLQQYIQQFDWNHGYLDTGMKFLNLMEEKFQRATGMYDILYSGETNRQMRSAQEAELKDRNSRSRIEDMRDRTKEWQSRVSRKEALGARFLHTSEDIARWLGPEAGQAWGFLAMGPVDPAAWAEEYMAQGLMPQDAQMLAQEQATRAVTLDQWRNEVDYDIESTSMRRRDVDQQIDALRELMNQTVPTQLQSMDPMERAMAYDTMATYYDVIGCDAALVNAQREMAARLRATGMMPAPTIAGPGAKSAPQEMPA